MGGWEGGRLTVYLDPPINIISFLVLIGFLGRILIKTTKKRYYIGGSR